MKNRSLIAIQFLLVLSMLSTQALGARKYAPNTSGTITATINACVGVTASSITFRYNTCNTTFTGTSYGIAIAYAWYQNTTNTTTGGTLVSSGTGTCAAATSGSLTYVPSTATAGTTYYYCKLTWIGVGACNTSGTLTSSGTCAVTVKDAPATIAGSSTLCTGATTTLTNTITGGTWSSNATGTATVGSTGIVTGVTNGPVTISYTTGCGTAASKTLTVSSMPTVNTTSGSTSVCAAATTNFSNGSGGGVWSSSNTGVATIGSTGTVTGVSNGTSIISYTITNTCGSATSAKSLTVNAAPAAISGNSSICASATTTLTNTTMYGTWSSNNTSIVTVGSTTGIATGIANGTTTITYATGCGTNATKLITVSNSTITGTTSICSGTTTTLTDPITGGTWSSSNTAVATIGTSGLVNGVSTGTSIISYSNGVCPATTTFSVKTTPSVISGINSLCSGTSTSLTNTASFGTWTSSNTSVATVNSWGTFAGVAQGTATITYSTGCGTAATKSVSVTNQPAAITGTTEFCATTTSTLANSVIGGTWSSSNTTVATVSGGVVTGVAAGTSNITYAIGACYATTTVLIDPRPNAGSITGSTTLCDGATTTFSNSAAGGVWSISDSTIAVIDATGFVTSQNPGTAIISYQVTNVCGTATTTVTLNEIVIPSVSDISGLGQVCKGSSITLSDTTVEAVWSSSNTSVATIGSTGLVMGVNSGTAMISYTWTNACGTDFDTTMITVNPLPTSITGITSVCVGLTTTLGNSIAGGVWSINNGNATIGSTSALVTGVASGSSVVTYTLPTGCLNTTTVTVNSQPAAITGTTSLCVGASTTLYNTTSGGTWSISNANAAIGSASGIVTGLTAGTAIATYSLASGCKSTTAITINALPSAIIGTTNLCVGSTTTLSNSTTGGIWSINNANAAIGSATGIVTGVTSGTSIATYTLGTGCSITSIITINALPSSISGTTSVCVGSTTTLSNVTVGGVWSINNANATIGSSTGVVTGVTSGTSIATYTLGTGCSTTTVLTINALPSAITGTTSVCVGSTTTLSDATTGGTWSINNANATIGSATGVVTGVTSGTSIATYTLGTGCATTLVITINALPSAITGTTSVCVGSTTTLSDGTTGGTWSINNANATIGSATGIVSGVASGTSIATYTLGTGCSTTSVISIYDQPVSISGANTVCISLTTALTCATSGGAWSSNNANASVGSTSGIVTGLLAGTSIISYTTPAGCYSTYVVTINTSPSAISGILSVCATNSTTLTNSISGGVWSTGSLLITIGTTSGVVTGLSAGTAIVSYTVGTGCIASAIVTVYGLPTSISGSSSVCVGANTNLTSSTTGVWSSSDGAGIITIGSASGVVSGLSAGTATITFTNSNGCSVNSLITVNSTPSAVTVSGTGYFCTSTSVSATGGTGGTIYYQGTISGGTSTAIPSTSQSISSTGTYYFRSQSSAGCWSSEGSATVTIPSITGFTTVCTGSTSALSDSARGGRWTSTNTSIAAIDSVSGVVSGVATGTSVITFVPYSGCTLNTTVTVITAPSAIVGATSVCRGSSITLSDSTSGGAWYSSAPTIASINASTGVLTGLASGYGSATITYYFGTRCSATTTITVNPYADITGSATTVCQGQSITLSDAVAGGVWSSSSTITATVGSSTGIVTGVAAGTTTISYRLSTGCTATYVVTVYPLSPISGPSSVCVGQTVALTDAVSGGTWRSTSPTIAGVALNTGIVTGAAAGYGTANIIYTTALGCMATQTTTVNALAVITGPTSVCQGQTMTLVNGLAGGTWSSSASGIASINASAGVVSGIVAGNATISYTMSTGCTTTYDILVNPLSVISGGTSVCVGFTTTLTSAITGGVWSSGSPTMATVGSSTGVVTGVVGLFTPTITYTLGTGCKSTIAVTVNALATIGGATNICVNSPYTVTNAVAGGTWSSSNTSVATIGSTGIITEVSAGTTTITYSLPSGCAAIKVMTVNPITPVIGATTICSGGTTSLNDATTGGTWASTTPGLSTIGCLTGLLTGVMAGTSCFTYKVTATGCRSTLVMTIKAAPAAILGSSVVCAGSTSTYTDTVINGFWTSGNTSVATIGSTTGILTGIANGTATITYSTGCGTDATKVISVSNSGITGALAVCTAATTNLSNASAGGTWVSNNPSIASVGSLNGTVTGVAGGATIISYINGACTAIATVTVNIAPAAITGTANVCTGTSSSLANTTPYGNWTSGNTSIATINSATGLMTGVAAGTSIITYSTGCASVATKVATVTSLATSITGSSNVCTGLLTTLSCTVSGGVWSGSNNAVLTVGSATGVVTGIATGSAIVSYTIPSGCFLTAVMNVNSVPSSITGLSSICVGQSTVLASTGAGSWSSSNSSITTIGTGSGIVTGITSGSAVITFTAATGCYTTTAININALPSTITGSSNICVGSSTTLSSTGSGTWSSANTSIATINATSGLVSGVASGTTTISYTLPTGCMIATIVTVNDLPASITGNVNVCSGASTTLSNTTTGGTWNSASVLVSVAPTTGVITGVSAGTAVVSYTLGTGCASTATVNVKSIPSAITGSLNVCYGATTTLSDITSGTWSSSNVTTATIGSVTGIVTGVYADTVSIIFTGNNGCSTSALVTVNPLPSMIGGANNVCVGSSITLTNSGSGTWSSNNTAVATVGAASGIVTGVTAGTTTITYTLATGCSTSTVITVKALPSAITGTASTCVSGTATLVETGGGTWSSSDYTVAYTNISSGVVTGISAGTATVTYMATNGCVATTVFTVNPNPSAITGSTNVCQGATSTLSNTSTGIWSSSNSSIASVNATTGVVTGIATGATTITLTLPTGCYTSTALTVNANPAAIVGSSTACVGMTTTMTDATASGTWTSTNTSVATINSVSGVLSGIAAGTTTVSYTTATGCVATQSVLVNAMPSVISGASSVCIGANATLTSGVGGTWSSSNTANLTIGSATGIATGIAAGTATVIYTAGTGCQVSTVITVNSLPASITGVANVCPSATSTLYNTSAGVWSTSNSSIATIGSLSGIVNGITAGTALVTYTIATGCVATQVVTVNPLPASITGATSVCQGLNATLTNSSIGGTWVSNNTSFASINSTSGVVTGVNPGSAIITYTLPTGCQITTNIAVNSLPAAITGNTSLTVGLTSTLSNTGTGTWSSANSLIASVSSAGVVTGVASGATTITFTIASGCYSTIAVDVNPVYPISGVSDICIGYTFTFSDATAGGNWSSSNTSVVTIGSSTGIVTGIANGTATITYNVPSLGYRVYNVIIHSTPTPITGSSSVCVGQNITLTEATSGGFWSTASPTIATVGSSTGVVTGVAGGLTVNIVYTLGSGCSVTKTITVNQLGAISGPTSVCAGQTLTMTNPYSGGTWTSSAIGIASIDASTGVVTGIAAGSATISYVLPTGCAAYAGVLVNALSPVTGPTSVCVGQSITLTNATTGGTWSSATPTIASIVSSTGVVTGYAGPLSTAITYTLPNGCKSTYTVSVNPQATIIGTTTLCAGTTTTLANTVAGGTWSSSNTPVATIGSTGIVTGITNGLTSITYSLPTGCYATTNVTVNALSAISGPSSVCLGQTVSLTNTVSGGVWSSSAPTVASIGSTGIVTGVAAGLAATVTYSLGTGCKATTTLTVNALAAIAGATSVCQGQTITLTNPNAGGTWSSNPTTVATIGTAGLVTGVAAGTVTISYALPSGCIANAIVTVNSLSMITGLSSVCVGQSITLGNPISGGTWSTSAPTIATVGTTGVVTGIAAGYGTANITYTLGTGCKTFATIYVNPLAPVTASATTVCQGQTLALADAIAGGTWSSSSAAIATVGTSGIVTGVGTGATMITYTLATGCNTTYTVTVNPLASITGSSTACLGQTLTLSNSIAGGTWSSSAPTIASVAASTGVVTGIANGLTANITYTLSNGCRATMPITVSAVPTVAAITGASTVSVSGSTITLADATTGGLWSSANAVIATIGTTGIVTGRSIGSVAISYTVTNAGGCSSVATKTLTVGPAPIQHTYTTGSTITVNVGATVRISENVTVGTWSASNDEIATVNNENGEVKGITEGRAMVTYTSADGTNSTLYAVVVNAENINMQSNQASTTEPTATPVVTAMVSDLKVLPNPNKGEFNIKGSVAINENESVTVEITNMLGQVVLSNQIDAKGGNVNEHIILGNNLVNGMYLITIRSGNQSSVMHMVIEQ